MKKNGHKVRELTLKRRKFSLMNPVIRYHGRASDMPIEIRRAVTLLIKTELDGDEIVTIGPSEVEIEFPLPPQIAALFNKHCIARPKGCRDARIYGLRDANGQYFYVGSTIRSLTDRLHSHVSSARHGKNSNVRLARRLLESPETVEIALIDTVAETHRFECEYEAIHDFLSKGIELLNTQLVHGQRALT